MFKNWFGLLLIYTTVGEAIVINELMPNPEGPESEVKDKNEFIELYNPSDENVDLDGFYFECGVSPGVRDEILQWNDTLLTDPNVVMNTTFIPAKGYAVVLPPGYTDSSSHFQPYWFREPTVVFTISTKYFGQNGLATTHHVWFFNPMGEVVDTYGSPDDTADGLPFDPGDGTSIEKIDPAGGDTERNWTTSVHESGSTPGMRNSVSAIYNLAISREDISFFPSSPMVGSNCEILLEPRNLGREWVSNFELTLFSDYNLDLAIQPDELIGHTTVTDSLEPLYGQSSVSFLWSDLEEGDHRIVAEIYYELDEDSSDNLAYRYLRVGTPLPNVIINEIMYNPLAGEPQWIEVYNRSSDDYVLKGFKISDSDTEKLYILPELALHPDEYCVITASASDFPYAGVEHLIEPEDGFPYFNKSEDIIFLRDGTGFVFESIHYQSSMGGSSGVSLERISPDVSSAQSVNWGSSLDPKGATPGKRNSLWVGSPSTAGSLTPAPNPFYPNGDGDKDFTIISYSLPYRLSKLKLEVYDVKGRKLRSLADGILVSNRGSLIWDGKDETGRWVPSGIYILYLEDTDTESPGVFIKKNTVVLGRK